MRTIDFSQPSAPKRILLLSGLKIFPNQTGGHLRTGSAAKALARLGHEVCIYSIAGRKSDYRQGTTILYQAIEENLVEEVNLSLSIGFVQTLARRIGLPRIWQYFLLSLGLIPFSLRNRLNWADVIICDLPYTPPIPGVWRNKTWLLLSHNLEHRLLAQGTWIEKLTAPWMQRIESGATLRYAGILACAKEDSEYFRARSLDPESIRLVANGIDPALYRRSDDEARALRVQWNLEVKDWLIVFSGSRFQPNLDALAKLAEFCRQEKEFLLAHHIKFLVLGSISSTAWSSETMIVTGPVPETFPYFAASDAALNPVQTGSGSNVKIFEYLAARLPVISTVFGARGTVLEADLDYLVFSEGRLKETLTELLQKQTKEEWKAHGERVWDRVKDSCDMTAIMRREWRSLPLKAPEEAQSIGVVPAVSNIHSH